jgi:hypothetical protein
MTSISTEKMINPSPPEKTINSSEKTITTTDLKKIQSENENYLLKRLRDIDNLCEAIKNVISFSDTMKEEAKIISLGNEMVISLTLFKYFLKSNIDNDYIDIDNKTQVLKNTMQTTYNNIDNTYDKLLASFKVIIDFAQKKNTPQSEPETMLDTMNKYNSKIPNC